MESIKGIENLNTSEVKSMEYMFYGCASLRAVDMSGFCTSNVTSMKGMFYGCSSLKVLNLNSFKTTKVTTMESMFRGCTGLRSLNVTSFNTEKVTTMKSTFHGCKQLTSLDLKSFNTANVTNMQMMFYGCANLERIIVSDKRWNTSHVGSCAGCGRPWALAQIAQANRSRKNLPSTMQQAAVNVLTMVSQSYKMFYGCTKLINKPGQARLSSDGSANQPHRSSGYTMLMSKLNHDATYAFTGGLLERGEPAGTYTVNVENNNPDIILTPFCPTVDEGGTATVYVTPVDKNANITVTIKGENGEQLTETNIEGEGAFEFQMPDNDVTVEATSEQPESPEDTPAGQEDPGDSGGSEGVTPSLMGDGVIFSVDGNVVDKAEPGTTVTVEADPSAVPPVGMQWAGEEDETDDSEGSSPSTTGKPVFVSTQGLVFTYNANGGATFTMPNYSVVVGRKYEPMYYALTGTNVSFYRKYEVAEGWTQIERITEASPGETVIVSPDPQTFEGGKYHSGTYQSEQVSTIDVDEIGDGWFTMPYLPVTVEAVLEDQGTLTIDLTSEQSVEITEETALYMTVMESYIIRDKDDFNSYMLDVDLNGTPDFKISGLNPETAAWDFGITTILDAAIALSGSTGSIASYQNENILLTVEANGKTIERGGAENNYYLKTDDGVVFKVPVQYVGDVVTVIGSSDYAYSVGGVDATAQITTHEATAAEVQQSYVEIVNKGGGIQVISNLKNAPCYAQKLAGANILGANYALVLRQPGLPLSYKDVLFKLNDEYPTVNDILLYESEVLPNGHTLETYNGQKVNVTLAERVLWKDGDWNTLCLPFSLTAAQIAASPLAGAEIRTLSSASIDNGTLTLNFTPAADLNAPDNGAVTSIEAGKPYLIRWKTPDSYVPYDDVNGNVTECSDIVAPVFKGVTLDNSMESTSIDGIVSLCGIYETRTFDAADPKVLFLGSKNKLYYPVEGATIGSFRVFFQLQNGIQMGDPSSGVRAFTVNFGEGEETAINTVTVDATPLRSGWFTMDGRRLNGQPAQRGVYLHDGRKVVVK